MAVTITSEIIDATKSTFNSEDRKKAIQALRQYDNSKIQQLADAFELGQNGKTLESIRKFKELADSAAAIGDQIHFATKMCCATAPIVTRHQNNTANYLVYDVASVLGIKLNNLDQLDAWRQKTYRELTAKALGIELSDFSALCNVLKNVNPDDLVGGVLQQTFVYAAVAALNFMRNPAEHTSEAQFEAFENVLKKFGNDFPRGHLIFARHLLIAGEYQKANLWLDKHVNKFVNSHPSLNPILTSYKETIKELQETTDSAQKQSILAAFLDSSQDPLAHPASTLSDSEYVKTHQHDRIAELAP